MRASQRPSSLVSQRLRLAVTCGEPAGVGPEVALRALAGVADEGARVTLVGPRGVWESAARIVGLELRACGWEVWEPEGEEASADWSWGRPTATSGRVAAEAVEAAARGCLAGRFDAMVTAPLTKEGLHAAGRPYPGHTELLEALCGTPPGSATMMLAGARLRVVLVTTHAALADVPRLVTREAVLRTIEATHRGLRDDLGLEAPRIAVAGLNPHAGEGGLLGREEIDAIAPAVAEARARGADARGPFAADGVVHRAYGGEFDAVVAMYHDQGLVAFKLAHFHDGVNVTLGLPLVRTSPDHGTAFDLAGRGTARADSTGEAVRWAVDVARRRKRRELETGG